VEQKKVSHLYCKTAQEAWRD